MCIRIRLQICTHICICICKCICMQCYGAENICFGSSSGSGSDFQKVSAPAPTKLFGYLFSQLLSEKVDFFMTFCKEYWLNSFFWSYSIRIMNKYTSLVWSGARSRNFSIPALAKSSGSLRLQLRLQNTVCMYMTRNRSWNRNRNQIKCRNRNRLQIFRFCKPALHIQCTMYFTFSNCFVLCPGINKYLCLCVISGRPRIISSSTENWATTAGWRMPSWSRSIGKKGDSFYFSWPKSEHYSPPPSFHIISPKSPLKRKMFFLKMSPDFSQCLRVYQSKLQMYSTVGYVGVSGTSTCIFSGVDFVFWFFYRMIWYTVRS